MIPPNSSAISLASAVAAALLVAKAVSFFRSRKSSLAPIDYFELSGVPRPQPLLNFDINEAKARPYRPFRWAYHQTMALKKLDTDYWLELESTYVERIAQRKKLYSKHGKAIIQMLPGSEAACRELVDMVIQWLCVRYPNQFHYDVSTRIFNNHILGAQSDVSRMEPLLFLLEHIPEDFIITQRDEKSGDYVFTAGIICSAMGWDLGAKIGKPLREIHQPVPDYKEKIEFSVDRYFSKLSCDKPIQRGSWSLEIGQPLFIPAGDPHFNARDKQRDDLKIEDLYLRVDWQTLRRLPISQAICFNYKALFYPLTNFRDEPCIPKLVAKILREGKKTILEYKSTYHVEHVVLPALDAWAKEQEERGSVPKDWEVRTLNEDPFFPGWDAPGRR